MSHTTHPNRAEIKAKIVQVYVGLGLRPMGAPDMAKRVGCGVDLARALVRELGNEGRLYAINQRPLWIWATYREQWLVSDEHRLRLRSRTGKSAEARAELRAINAVRKAQQAAARAEIVAKRKADTEKRRIARQTEKQRKEAQRLRSIARRVAKQAADKEALDRWTNTVERRIVSEWQPVRRALPFSVFTIAQGVQA